MSVVLGIDGGGTRTRAVVMDVSGAVLGRGESGTANLDDVGPEVVRRHLREATDAARREAGLGDGSFAAAFLGLAGVVSEKDRAAIRAILEPLGLAPDERTEIDHDCRIALAGGLSGRPGIVLIAGTGSSCYGRTADGRSWLAGGWGHLLADEGSSYWLAVEGLKAAVRAHDGRGPATSLVGAFVARLGLADLHDIMHRLYVDGLSRAELAALAPLVLDAAREGDGVALGLLDRGARHLAETVAAVARRLGFDRGPCEVVRVGGLFRSGALVLDPLSRHLHALLPEADLHAPEDDPAVGAALLARGRGARLT